MYLEYYEVFIIRWKLGDCNVRTLLFCLSDSKQTPRATCSAVTQQARQPAAEQREGMEGTAGCDGKTKQAT